MFTFVPWEPWRSWESTSQGQRGGDYEALKERLSDRMIAAADEVIPGLSKAIVFRSVGTPLTNAFYCESPFGCSYGTAKTPFQLGPFSYRMRAEIPGLYLCGASTLSHGIAGASISGLMTAQRILGAKSKDDVLGPPDGSLRVYPSDQPEQWLYAAETRRRDSASRISLDRLA
jgi:all-trans-retinol 13,14-reductase